MENKKFLIIMPYYNPGECFEEAIESVIQQKYKNWELVLLNDASTDGSEKLADRYKNHEKISFLYNVKNEGCYYSINKALLANSNGDWDYWNFSGADDSMDLNRLNKINDFLSSNPNVVGLKTTYIRMWHETKKIDYENGKPHITTSEGNAFYSKKILPYLGYYDNTRFSGDTDYWWRLENFIKLNPKYNFKLGEHKDPLIVGYLRNNKNNLTLKHPIPGRQQYYQRSANDIQNKMIPNNNFYRDIF